MVSDQSALLSAKHATFVSKPSPTEISSKVCLKEVDDVYYCYVNLLSVMGQCDKIREVVNNKKTDILRSG